MAEPASVPVAVWSTAAGTFCIVLTLLALQVRSGEDPAIGAGQEQAPPPRPVVVRRIIERREVAGPRLPTAPAAAPSAPPAAPAPVAAPAPAPVVSRAS